MHDFGIRCVHYGLLWCCGLIVAFLWWVCAFWSVMCGIMFAELFVSMSNYDLKGCCFVSFWVILLLIIVGFLVGFAFGGFLYSRSVESVSQDHVDAVRRVTSSFDERARRSREASNSVLSYVTGGEFGKSSEAAGADSLETVSEDSGSGVGESYAEALQHEMGDDGMEYREKTVANNIDGRDGDTHESGISSRVLISSVDYVPERGEDFDEEGIADTTQFTMTDGSGYEDIQAAGSSKWIPGREAQKAGVEVVEDAGASVPLSDDGAGSLSDSAGENIIEDGSIDILPSLTEGDSRYRLNLSQRR